MPHCELKWEMSVVIETGTKCQDSAQNDCINEYIVL